MFVGWLCVVFFIIVFMFIFLLNVIVLCVIGLFSGVIVCNVVGSVWVLVGVNVILVSVSVGLGGRLLWFVLCDIVILWWLYLVVCSIVCDVWLLVCISSFVCLFGVISSDVMCCGVLNNLLLVFMCLNVWLLLNVMCR